MNVINRWLPIYLVVVLASTYFFQSFYITKLGIIILGIFALCWFIKQYLITKTPHRLFAFFLVFFFATFAIHGLHITLATLALLIGFCMCSYGLRLLIPNTIIALFSLIILIVGLSLFPPTIGVVCSLVCLGTFAIIFVYHWQKIKQTVTDDCHLIASLNFFDAFGWMLLFMVTLVLGFFCKEGLIASDAFHPIYELSIGQSYANGIMHAPDLSYSGKIVRYHFLGTKLPLYFANLFNIHPLSGLYFITPLFFILICFMLINAFFALYPLLATPLLVIFFMPFLNTIEYYGSLFRTSLVFSPSYFLAFLLMLCTAYFLITARHLLLLITALLLLITKASFFFVVLGGVTLFFVRTLDFKKLFMLTTGLVLFFIPTYFLFLSGAHQQTLWIFAPVIATYQTLHQSITSMLVIMFFLACTLAAYLFNKEDTPLLALSSLGLSGLFGMLLVTDIIEGNHCQFYIAVYFPLVLVTWYVGKKLSDSRRQLYRRGRTIIQFVCTIILFNSMLFYLNRPFLRFMQLLQPQKRVTHAPTNLINAYAWLGKNIPQDSIVFFSKHYEEPYTAEMLYSQTGHIRSAVSGKQMFCESYNWKGVMMEPDFATRVAFIMKFYKHTVILSPSSQTLVNRFFATMQQEKTPVLPLSQSTQTVAGFSGSMIHTLSLGKEWCLNNRHEQVIYEISNVVRNHRHSEQEILQFLTTSAITHIVLENNDQPSEFLQSITQKIYEQSGIIILHVL